MQDRKQHLKTRTRRDAMRVVLVFGGDQRRNASGSSIFLDIFDQGIGQMVVDEFEVSGIRNIDHAVIIRFRR